MIVKVQRNRIKRGRGTKFILLSAFVVLSGFVLVCESVSAVAQTRSVTPARLCPRVTGSVLLCASASLWLRLS